MNFGIKSLLCTVSKTGAIISIAASLLFYWYLYTLPNLSNRCEIEKCPYCFGKDYCAFFDNDALQFSTNSFEEIINNYLSVKNVYHVYSKSERKQFILKKLGDSSEMYELDELICLKNQLQRNCKISEIVPDKNDYYSEIKTFLLSSDKNKISKLKICSEELIDELIQSYMEETKCKNREEECLKNLWTILQINPEPIILLIFKSFYVPKYFGACGRMVVVEDAGQPLNTIKNFSFTERLRVAREIMFGAILFTEKHAQYKLYLTDLSPDNIAIDTNLRVKFIDLENVILTLKVNGISSNHHSVHVPEYDFAYSEERVCASELSDHNYYAVCRLILSSNAPWPMMDEGLLHSPPKSIQESHQELFLAIEDCVDGSTDRFQLFHYIFNQIDMMLNEM